MYRDDYPTCAQTYATLILLHEDLNAELLTQELGIQPTETWKQGEVRNPGSRTPVVSRIGGWFLRTQETVASRDVRRHIDWLLNQVEPRRSVLGRLRTAGYRMEISCFWVSAFGHGGPTLSPAQMARLADLGLEVWFDVYLDGSDRLDHENEEADPI